MKELSRWLKGIPLYLKGLLVGSIVVELIFCTVLGAVTVFAWPRIQKLQKAERAVISPEQIPFIEKFLPSKPESQSDSSGEESVLVTRVIDGDTIEVEGDRKVRYIGIDCPEEDQLFSREATATNKKIVEGRIVTLVKDVSNKDAFGRLLRYVYIGDVFVNAKLVEEGLAEATPYPPDLAHEDEFDDLEKKAKDSGKGMWTPSVQPQGTSPQRPQEQKLIVYINEPGLEYHLLECEKLGSGFSSTSVSLDVAKARGFVPCGLCDPP